MKKLLTILVLALGICAFAAAPALAEAETREAEIVYREIKLVLDGREICPRDAAGNEVEPFILDGTTYLPVRAVADALGLEVRWRESDSTVLMKSPVDVLRSYTNDSTAITSLLPQELPAAPEQPTHGRQGTESAKLDYRNIRLLVNGRIIQPKDADGNAIEPFIIDGTTYLPVRAVAGALGIDADWDGENSTVTLKRCLVSKYTQGQKYYGSLLFSNVTEYEYNSRAQLVRTVSHNGDYTLEYSYRYDELGRLVEKIPVNGEILPRSTRYSYSDDGLHASAQIDGVGFGENEIAKREYEYNGDGQLISATLIPKGPSRNIYGEQVEFFYRLAFSYDGAARLTLLNVTISVDNQEKDIFRQSFSYDENGNLARMSAWSIDLGEENIQSGGDVSTFIDDKLVEMAAAEYVYDGDGRLQRYRGTSIAGGETETITGAEYRYDELGRLTAIAANTQGESYDISYSYGENGMVSIEWPEPDAPAYTFVRIYEYAEMD